MSKCSSVVEPSDSCVICSTCNQANALEQFLNDKKLPCTVVATDPKRRSLEQFPNDKKLPCTVVATDPKKR